MLVAGLAANAALVTYIEGDGKIDHKEWDREGGVFAAV